MRRLIVVQYPSRRKEEVEGERKAKEAKEWRPGKRKGREAVW
jgi:hypothetical protein